MKKIYFLFVLTAIVSNANAQCSSCTVTVSSTDVSNHIILSGQTYCITGTGTVSGLITINAGGTLCNQGNISSTHLWVNGGTLNNYGTINTNNILVSAQGVFNNNVTSNATIDSLLIEDVYSALNNSGTITGNRLGNVNGSSITNYRSITENYIGDSAAQFNNYGNVKINFDLYNAYNSGFFNAGYLDIDRDFLNSYSSTFQTDCMVQVGRDWYNSAIVLGPPTGSCGGFAVVGQTLTSGTVGNSSTHIDICDAGSPTFGFDGPGGTIASTTTHCACTNNCAMVGISEQIAQSDVLIQNLFPNPAQSALTIGIENKKAELLLVEVLDMMGRKQLTYQFNASFGSNKTTIDVSKLAQGTYILNIIDSQKLTVKKMFSVIK